MWGFQVERRPSEGEKQNEPLYVENVKREGERRSWINPRSGLIMKKRRRYEMVVEQHRFSGVGLKDVQSIRDTSNQVPDRAEVARIIKFQQDYNRFQPGSSEEDILLDLFTPLDNYLKPSKGSVFYSFMYYLSLSPGCSMRKLGNDLNTLWETTIDGLNLHVTNMSERKTYYNITTTISDDFLEAFSSLAFGHYAYRHKEVCYWLLTEYLDFCGGALGNDVRGEYVFICNWKETIQILSILKMLLLIPFEFFCEEKKSEVMMYLGNCCKDTHAEARQNLDKLHENCKHGADDFMARLHGAHSRKLMTLTKEFSVLTSK